MSPAGRHFGLLAVASAKRPEDVVDCAPSPYVSYKLRNVDDETRQQYAKKIGGIGDYRRDMAREAAVLWKNR